MRGGLVPPLQSRREDAEWARHGAGTEVGHTQGVPFRVGPQQVVEQRSPSRIAEEGADRREQRHAEQPFLVPRQLGEVLRRQPLEHQPALRPCA